MSSKIMSSVDPTVHLLSKPNQSPNPRIFTISFSSGRQSGPFRARATARMESFYAPTETKETLYELLGIAEGGSSFSDIKKAYKEMARKYHPDVSPPERVEEYTQRFIMVHEAYETLSNPQTRALYDRNLAVGFPFSSEKQHEEMHGKEEWQSRWLSQLDELQRRDCRDGTSWGARMRNSSVSCGH